MCIKKNTNLQQITREHHIALFKDFKQKHYWKKFKPNEEFKTDKKTSIYKIKMAKNPLTLKVAVVLNARNEEKHLGKTLEFLQAQQLKPYRIIVVNDGSTDKTGEIASSYDVEVVERKKRKENFVARKELAETVNAGLEKLDEDTDCDYILLMSAEIHLPKNYLTEVVKRMENNPKLVVAAGVIRNEYTVVPRGPGRVVKYDFWKKLGLRYPINYWYEGYLLWKAQSMGYEIASFGDIISNSGRKTGSNYEPKRYYYYGLGLKALGYSSPYAFARILIFAKKNPRGAYHMLRGYLSNYNDLYEPELRKFVRKTQLNNIFHFNLEYLKRFLTGFKNSK